MSFDYDFSLDLGLRSTRYRPETNLRFTHPDEYKALKLIEECCNEKFLFAYDNLIGVGNAILIGPSFHVTRLHLEHRIIPGSILPDVFDHFSHLRELLLLGNDLSELPKSINKLSNLEILDIYGNQFTSIPQQLNDLSTLKKLIICSNPLTNFDNINNKSNLVDLILGPISYSFSDDVFFPNLNQLYVSGLEIDDGFSEFIERHKSLEILSILNMNKKFTSIPSTIQFLPKLKKLFINRSNISKIPDFISRMTTLQIVSFSNNRIKDIPLDITNLKNLESFSVTKNPLNPLPDALKYLVQNNILFISGYPIYPLTIKARLNNMKLRFLPFNFSDPLAFPNLK
ncbi:MAG: leucine-rich repeat domain-containing protein, partial [Candidatus Thorarchaeota archaeon]